MRQGTQNKSKINGVMLAVVAFAAAGLAVPLKSSTLDPSMMFLLGFSLIGLRIYISHRLNKTNQLPAKAR
jgi:hypothetical protein